MGSIMNEIENGVRIRLDPIQCFTFNRLDLVFKTIYGESILHNSQAVFPRKVYKHHLFSITGSNGKFVEHGSYPPKKGFPQFDETFKSLINGNTEEFPPVRVDKNVRLNNGAHRVVAGYLQQKTIAAEVDEQPRGIMADYNFFRRANRWRYRLNQETLDYALLRLVKLNSRIQILVVFPSVRNRRLIAELRNHEDFFLERNFRLNPIAKSKLLHFLYPQPANFINRNLQNNQNAFRDRFNRPGKLRLMFFENQDLTSVSKLKKTMRLKYRLPNGSLHTPECSPETIHLLEILLIKNSRKALHSFDFRYIDELRQSWTRLQNLKTEAAIVGSSPLALLGMRSARDLDLIIQAEKSDLSTHAINSHNSYWRHRGFNVDELIANPRNFICVYGIKLISIPNIFHFKLRRHERKDLRDIVLISKYFLKKSVICLLTIKHFTLGYLRILRNFSRILAR